MTRSRVLGIAGLVAMIAGALDPLEGSIVILAGSGLAAWRAFLGDSRFKRLQLGSVGLIATAVVLMIAMSIMGGVNGRNPLLVVAVFCYLSGWVTGIVGAGLMLRGRRLEQPE